MNKEITEKLSQKLYKCPICKMKKPTSPIIHGLSLMKTYTAHGLKLHIATHRKGKDKDLVKQWKKEDGNIESCRVDWKEKKSVKS